MILPNAAKRDKPMFAKKLRNFGEPEGVSFSNQLVGYGSDKKLISYIAIRP